MIRLLLKKNLFLSFLVICIGFLPIFSKPTEAATFTEKDGLLIIGGAAYEIAFSATNGGIAYILDKATGEKISDGNTASNLWIADLAKGDSVAASTYNIEHSWDATSNQLTLTYTGNPSVTVAITASENDSLKMQAMVSNTTGTNIANFSFPHELQVTTADITDGLLPMMPGALLNAEFFTKQIAYVNLYPGAMFADYLAIRSGKGNLALYTQKGSVVQPAFLGYEPVSTDSPYTKLTHRYRTWIADGKTWASPWIVLRIGQTYNESILAYRTDNGIDQYKSLTDKLGEAAPTYFAAPMYKLDVQLIRRKFDDLQTAIFDNLVVPGIVHVVAYTLGGHDKNYPDFVPPDPRWGTTEQFADLVNYIHSKNGLVIPYTNFSWWDINGLTMTSLPQGTTIIDVVAAAPDGSIIVERYGPSVGYVMNLHHPFVKQKIDEQHDALINTIRVDGIFEDQYGVRNVPYDFAKAGLETFDPATSYFEGILAQSHAHASHNLVAEQGIDVMAEDSIAFMGSNYLWDMLGLRPTASLTTYYPMAGMMLRDKVLLFQHNLAAETWTKDMHMLRWNLVQGYSLSNAFYDHTQASLNMENPWLTLIGIFQKYALANYADELVLGFDTSEPGITRTAFSTYDVIANWNAESSYEVNGHVLPPGGVVTTAKDRSVTAGTFTYYNGSELTSGEHYIVEARSEEGIKVFQPIGANTPLHINLPPDTSVIVTAYTYDGAAISQVASAQLGSDLRFEYDNFVDGQFVGYYLITRSDGASFK
jgi:hypothetical protein